MLCADDMIRPDGIENLVSYMENNPELVVENGSSDELMMLMLRGAEV